MVISGLLSLIVVLVITGVVLWLIEAYVPMAEPFKVVIRVIVVLALVLYVLNVFGIWAGGPLLRR